MSNSSFFSALMATSSTKPDPILAARLSSDAQAIMAHLTLVHRINPVSVCVNPSPVHAPTPPAHGANEIVIVPWRQVYRTTIDMP